MDGKIQPMNNNWIDDRDPQKILSLERNRGQFNSENKMQPSNVHKNMQAVSQWKQSENKSSYQVK